MPRNGSRRRARAQRASARRKFGVALGAIALLLGLIFAPTSRTDQSNVENGPQGTVDVLDLMTGISTPAEPNNGNSTSQAINPFSASSPGSDGLVALEIENDSIDAVASTQPHVAADVFGLGLEMPLVLALGQFEDTELPPSEFDANGWHGGGGSSAGFFGGGGSGAGAAAGGGPGRIDTTGKGLGGPGEGNGPGGNGPDIGGPGNNDFTFLPDEILTGSKGRGVSPFPVANGLTILSIDSEEGFGEETAPVALEENLDLVPNPEPASLILLGSGLVVAASRLRRRAR